MKISAKSWHFQYQWRIYNWTLWFRKNDAFNPSRRLNLCSYLRGFIWTTLALPVMAIILPFVGFIFGFVRIAEQINGWWDKRPPPKPKPEKPSKIRKSKPGPTLWQLTRKYLKAKHEKTCPLIELEDPPVFYCPYGRSNRQTNGHLWFTCVEGKWYSRELYDQHMTKYHSNPDGLPPSWRESNTLARA